MSFHNVRLSKCVELGASGGPGFKTSIVETSSGDEYRNIEWSKQRGRWEVGYTNDHRVTEEIIAFFHVRRGRAYGFRFRDWSDYKVESVIGIGDGVTTQFQAVKVYSSGEQQFVRTLTRLVAPVSVLVNDVVTPASVDVDTGKIQFSSPPAATATIAIRGEFDVPVRFDTDDLPITMMTQHVSRIEGVPLIEIRDRHEQT